MLKVKDYSFSEKIHEGSRSIVYRGNSQDRNLSVICKILSSEYPSSEEYRQFEREFQMIQSLNHSGIIKVYQLLPIASSLGIVMEDFGGVPLAGRIRSGDLTLTQKFDIACQIAETLAYIHEKGIIHKDINPSNIVIEPKTLRTCIIDFGISSQLSSENISFSDVRGLEGTLYYISPEQTGRMNRSIDLRSDLYSTGITLYELFSGTKPFTGESPLELVHCHIAKKAKRLWDIDKEIPPVLSEIVEKLMEKNSDDRYQTAVGLLADLQKCRDLINANRENETFELGLEDPDDRFEIPQFLYGRKQEIDLITGIFEKACHGRSELLLVSGYSGVGKTSIIHELHRSMSHIERYYCSGKFDQYKQNIPYSGIAQALSSLIRQGILVESEEELSVWKEKFSQSLGSNISLVTALIPEVGLIVGVEAIQEVSIKGNENRFHFALLNLVRCIAQNRPLIIFLDDLQWADLSSFKLIKVLLRDPDLKSIMIIGAYRNNEVDAMHPLLKLKAELSKEAKPITEIVLAPLLMENVCELLADTLNRDGDAVRSLAGILMQKTGGNPFFINQLLMSMHEDSLIRFDPKAKMWVWDEPEIEQVAMTENIVDLMVKKINRMSEGAIEILTFAACIGNRFDLLTLSIVAEKSVKATYELVWEPIKMGLILPLDRKYKTATDDNAELVYFKFLHDRVQQASYSLLNESNRSLIHLKIGRLLQKNLSNDTGVFDIVQHMNKGRALIHKEDEKAELALLNRKAAKKAKISAAYHSAVEFLSVAEELIGPSGWKSSYEIHLATQYEMLEALYLDAQYEKVHQLSQVILSHVRNPFDGVDVYSLDPLAYISESKPLEALRVGLSGLRILNLVSSELKRDRFSIRKALLLSRMVWRRKRIASLIDRTEISDRRKAAVVKILGRLMSACYFADPQQLVVNTCMQVRISIKDGHSAHASKGYATYGMLLCSAIGDLKAGYEFGRLAMQLAKKSPFESSICEVEFLYNCFIRHSQEPLQQCVASLEQNYLLGLETGEIEFAAYCLHNMSMLPFIYGENLHTMVANIEKYTKVIETKLHHATASEMNKPFWQAYLNLTGDCQDPMVLKGPVLDEDEMVPAFTKRNHKTCLYMTYLVKTVICYLLHDWESARKNAELSKKNHAFLGHPNHLMFLFFDSLIYIEELNRTELRSEQMRIKKCLKANQKRLKNWAENSPKNYLHKFNLVEAEIARCHGDYDKAQKLYDQAIQLAHENGFLSDEALASELYARFWRQQGREKIANVYLREAHHLYDVWGSKAKVKHLEKEQPFLAHHAVSSLDKAKSYDTTTLVSTATTTTSRNGNSNIDTDTVVSAAQTIAGETDLKEILKRLMKLTIENAGAQKGCLILSEDGSLTIKALATTDQEVAVSILDKPIKFATELPKSVINYVLRTGKHLVINNPGQQGDFSQDPYIVSEKPKSIVGMPIRYQAELVGVLYLENKLAVGAFTDRMMTILAILATQGAISIANARHVVKLKEMVDHIQELVDQRTRHITGVMKHIQQGIFTILPNFTIEEYYSDHLESIFEETDISGMNPIKLLRKAELSGDEMARIENCLASSLGEDQINFQINAGHLPREIVLNNKIVEMDWQNIVDDQGNTEKVMIVARDVTAVRALERETHRQKEEMLRVEELLACSRDKVQAFFDESKKYLSVIERLIKSNQTYDPASLKTIFVNYHTLKGLSRSQNFRLMVDCVHKAETLCAGILNGSEVWHQNNLLNDYEMVMGSLSSYMNLSRDKLGRLGSDGTGIDRKIIGRALEFIAKQPMDKRQDIQDVESAFRSVYYVSSLNLFAEIFGSVPALAAELGKAKPVVDLSGPDVYFTPEAASLVRSCFVHLIRNSMDHGIESVEERRKAGKPDEGTVRVRLVPLNGAMEIHFSDDGAGLNLAKIRKIGVKRGLIHAAENDPMSIANLIFQAGFSTADSITEISGRGVGIDAIRTLVENEGETFTLRFLEECFTLDKPVAFEAVIRINHSKYTLQDKPTDAVKAA